MNKKIFTSIIVVCLTIFLLAGCDASTSSDDDYDYSEENPTYWEDDVDAGTLSDDDYDYSEGNPTYSEDDAVVSEDTNSSDTTSLDNVEITDEFARVVYAALKKHSFEKYKTVTAVQWLAYTQEEKHQAYEDFSAIHKELGFKVNLEDAWIRGMDEDAEFYSTDYYIFSFAIRQMGFDDPEVLFSLYNYAQGLDEEKYKSLHPKILSAADDITVEYYVGSYLLCIGGTHNIVQMTQKWTDQESSFIQTGSVTPTSTKDAFKDIDMDYTIGGEDGYFQQADFGAADLLPVFKAIGAIDKNGKMIQGQIQISAKGAFDAPKLFVLTQQSDGIIKFSVVEYDKDSTVYDWNGEVFTTSERCCFDKDGNFLYIDEAGTLQMIPA